MQRLTILALLCLCLGACGAGGFRLGFPGVYRIDIAQGNIVTQEMIDQLKPGMTKRQVRFIMGTPLIVDTFEPERWDYFHSMNKKGKQETQERVSLYFENDKLVRFSGDFAPSSGKQTEAPKPAAAEAPAAAKD
jgi:outer membrane protein assembly factor BamE